MKMAKNNDASNELDFDNVQHIKLDKTFFPETWDDDLRMNVLMAPFRTKAINPQNYESKLNFWRNLIIKYCEIKGSPNVTIPELRCAFKRNTTKPYGIDTVFQELMSATQIKTTDEFLQIPAETWTGWALGTMSKSLYWGYSKVKERLGKPSSSSTVEYIVLEAVKKQAEKLQSKFAKEKVLTIETIINNLDETGITADGVKFALHYLVLKENAAIETLNCMNENITIVKIVEPNSKIKMISKHDRAIFELNRAEMVLIKNVDELEQDVNKMEDIIRKYLRENKKQLAMTHLKRKRNLQKQLEQKSNSLDRIQSILTELENTTQNAKILDAFKIGSDVLKSTLADSGITVDTVDEIISDLKESVDTNDEIQAAMGMPVNVSSIDETALEDELDDLLRSEKDQANRLDESIERRLRQLNINGFTVDQLTTPGSSNVPSPAPSLAI